MRLLRPLTITLCERATAVTDRTCSVEDCNDKHKAKGFCNTHYERRRLGLSLVTPVRQYERGERLCKIKECGKPRACSADLCAMHYYRPRKRLNRYGLTPAQFDQLLADQDGQCAICTTTTPGTIGWCVDHDHKSGHIRGVLCGTCNSGLGMLNDDPALLAAAIVYLQRERS